MGDSSAQIDMKLLKRLDRFDEFIRKSQGLSKQGVLDYDDLCLFPNVQLPEGFKTPKFNKYDGTGNPKTHLRLFANKLGKPVDDENLPLRLFPESLEGDALDWYSNLKPEEVKTWLDLSNAFIRQYEYNCELAPTRTTLEGTKRKPSEDHKTYAKRWRKVAAKLKAAGKISTVPPPTYPYGMPAWYNPQAVCTYHSGAPGHSTLDCKALKHKIQDMVEVGEIVIRRREAQGPNVNRNPLPEHANIVGVILDDAEYVEQVKKLAREAEVFGITDQPFVIELPFEEDEKPFILDLTPAERESLKPVVIEFPKQEPVLSLQQVPWNYDEPDVQIGEKSIAKKEVSVVTRTGKIANPREAASPIRANNSEPPVKPTITEKEALDLLKRLQRSEYNVVEKLSKSPAQISMLDLLFSSDTHRDALIEVLTKAQIPRDISVDNFSHVVGSVLFTKQITFSDDELPVEGIGHNKALYIVVRCNGKMLPKVLIDNGSALNICPWSTLEKLGLQDIKLRPSGTIIRGFDGAQREPIGEVDLVVEIGPAQFQITCQVMHFPSVYNILLGRPWIHKSGAVPSSLHQLLKFVVNDKLITIFAEEDCLVITDSGSKENGSRNVTMTPHSTADIVSVSWITNEERVLPKASVMMAKEMIRGGYEFDKGLGRDLQGILKPVEIVEKKDSFGLGFRPTAKDIREMKERKKAEKEGRQRVLDIPPLHYTFPRSAEVIMSEINPVDEIEASLAQLFVGATFEDIVPGEAEFPDILEGSIPNWTAETEDHLDDLRKLFERLRKYNLKLNPAKCAFGAPAGKLLGFIVSKRGIEIDPAKIKAIREMPVPKTQKDVKSFLGKINFIGRFIAQLTATCEPLFKLLRKNVPLYWNEECQQDFDKIKDYLLHPPVLYLLEKPMLTGRLAKWQIILSEFDIVFTSQKAVKGQAIADHLAENPRDNDYQPLHTYFPDEKILFVGATDDISEQSPEWRLFFDGASNSLGAGIGAVLYPDELKIEPIQIQFQDKPAHCWAIDKPSDNVPWYNDIKEFVKTGSYPLHAAEVEIPSLRILMEAKLEEADWIKQRHEQLTSIDERRFNAICHGQCYQKRVARAYNKKVRRRAFEEGDKVLKRILSMQNEAKGKFAPNWQGPFIVQKALPHQDINKKQQPKEEMFTPTTKLVLEEIAGGNCSMKDDAYGSSGVNRSLDFPKGLSKNDATPVETLSKEPSTISEQCTKEGPEDSNPPENIEDKSSKEA
ncbi:uncharacterized protein [Coffea arabica]|uniref:G-patch domain-containing protein n=1 Tax=Coffea arabica TaxID=13443 RepID=A0ABM4W8H5_COFAR